MSSSRSTGNSNASTNRKDSDLNTQTSNGGGGPPIVVARRELKAMEAEFLSALPEHIPVKRFNRVVMTGIQNNPDLLACDRKSLWNACMRAAQDGLLPDGREGALVPYKREVQWIPMVGGLLKKIRNSGELKSMTTKVVMEGDQFEHMITHEGETLMHKPQFGREVAPTFENIIGAYCVARTKDDATYILVMSQAQIEQVRKSSRAKSGPWFDWYDQMCEKTVIRRISKRLPISSDLDDLIRRDDHMYDMDLDATEVREENMLGSARPTRGDDEDTAEPESTKSQDEWYQAGWKARLDGVAFKDAPADLAALDYDAWANGWENCDKVEKGKAAERETQEVTDVEDTSEGDDDTPEHDPDTGEIADDEPEPEPEKEPAKGKGKAKAKPKTKEEVAAEAPENVTPGTQAFRDGEAAFAAGQSIYKVPNYDNPNLTQSWRDGWDAAEKAASGK